MPEVSLAEMGDEGAAAYSALAALGRRDIRAAQLTLNPPAVALAILKGVCICFPSDNDFKRFSGKSVADLRKEWPSLKFLITALQ